MERLREASCPIAAHELQLDRLAMAAVNCNYFYVTRRRSKQQQGEFILRALLARSCLASVQLLQVAPRGHACSRGSPRPPRRPRTAAWAA